MSAAVALMLLSLGCAPAQFNGPHGAFVVWVCPPVTGGTILPGRPAPQPEPEDERES
jgi:hypothetical protein